MADTRPPGVERRHQATRPEIRDAVPGSDSIGTLVGDCVVYDSLSEDLGGFRERVRPGAFAASLAVTDVRAFFDHDPGQVLGRQSSGTLRVEDSPSALRFEIELPDTTFARDLVVSIRRGDISGMSFGFVCQEDEWSTDDAGQALRTIVKAEFFEGSVVSIPAYPDTSVALRSRPSGAVDPVKVPRHRDEILRFRLRLQEKSCRSLDRS